MRGGIKPHSEASDPQTSVLLLTLSVLSSQSGPHPKDRRIITYTPLNNAVHGSRQDMLSSVVRAQIPAAYPTRHGNSTTRSCSMFRLSG
ncbi:hypothetical protein M430DRAFT_36009 [Amorphotheca resinae ATCC 22711]|uniref:Uncharacterized protein n=1 Tax=Amorphotheca resinae ATCC 22711 TaxID=857342 RepID=A0A2T3AZ42_AMORE|nr:hypothetical protein M430DRAFT_36009 [Amorphotheca resinae ATCC 22711]PSS15345.1 hypothetical protein M430DRAFT_36009 [Amorphotheca resinae ATCC 22711]